MLAQQRLPKSNDQAGRSCREDLNCFLTMMVNQILRCLLAGDAAARSDMRHRWKGPASALSLHSGVAYGSFDAFVPS